VSFALGSSSGAKEAIGSVTDNHNGTYSATVTGAVDGSNTIVASIGGQPATTLAPSIDVIGAAVSTAKSTLKVTSYTVTSGGTTTITLQAENAKGQKETAGGLTVGFKLASTKGGQGTFSSVTDNGNGTYTVTFTGTIASTNSIKATIDGVTATASAAVKVVPGAISLAKSTITVSSATVKSSGLIVVALQARDADGNKITTGGQHVVFSVGSQSGGQGTVGAAVDHKNGTYTATFTATQVGTNTITATVGGSAVTSTPPTITVTPGSASVATSVVSVNSTSIVSGTSVTVTLQAKDAHGNLETTGGLKVAFGLGKATGAKGTFSAVKDNKNGTYTATFTATTEGTNTIVATIGGLKVSVNVPTISVAPGALSLAKTTVTVLPATAKVGGTIAVTLQAKDAAGNDITTGGLIVAFALASTKGGQGTFGSVTDNGNGTYSSTFSATAVGTNEIGATIGVSKVTSIEPAIKVLS
jgi:hypothetical protein